MKNSDLLTPYSIIQLTVKYHNSTKYCNKSAAKFSMVYHVAKHVEQNKTKPWYNNVCK